jgi:hypothetical protein
MHDHGGHGEHGEEKKKKIQEYKPQMDTDKHR